VRDAKNKFRHSRPAVQVGRLPAWRMILPNSHKPEFGWPIPEQTNGKIPASDSPRESERRHCVTIPSCVDWWSRASGSATVHLGAAKIHLVTHCEGGDIMKRRHLLNLVFGVAAGIAVFAATANAAPLPPISPEQALVPPRADSARPAVVAQDEVDRLKPIQIHWHHHHHHHHHWHHRHWHHHHWHHWHHWHHHHWHHHHWHHHHHGHHHH
jgi:hypothetical protein